LCWVRLGQRLRQDGTPWISEGGHRVVLI
jgi:hypothetical protein